MEVVLVALVGVVVVAKGEEATAVVAVALDDLRARHGRNLPLSPSFGACAPPSGKRWRRSRTTNRIPLSR
eukprot:9476567-Pyramimonas_sp.AAC.1